MLPIRTTLNDIKDVTAYLLKKPTGATLKEAKSVFDSKRWTSQGSVDAF